MAHGKSFSNVTLAIVKDLSCDLILGSDVVDRLNEKASDEVFDANYVINLDESDDDSDATDVDVKVVNDADNDRNVANDQTDHGLYGSTSCCICHGPSRWERAIFDPSQLGDPSTDFHET